MKEAPPMQTRPALWAALALAACGTPPAPPPGGGPRVFELAVTAHPLLSAPLAEPEADRILADASRIVSTPDGDGDRPCPMELRRAGGVRPLPLALPAFLRSAQDFARLSESQPGEQGRAVRIVQAISWCGFEADNIIGCASIPGDVLVVRRFAASLEGQLWAHEFGHNRGLDHVNEPRRIMFPAILPEALQTTGADCAAYLAPSPAVAAAAATPPRFPSALQVQAEAVPTEPLAFVRRIYPHGFPLSAARRFTPEQAASVWPLLRDPASDFAWSNIVLLAGAAGAAGVARDLIAFLNDADWNPGNPAASNARAQVPIALGYLSNRLDDRTALDFLLARSRPGAWAAFAARARTPEAQLALERQMATQTLIGLSLSGRPPAIARLEAMQATLRRTDRSALQSLGAATGDPETLARDSQMLQQALERARSVQQGGLEAVRP
jgi:hypothetical protein